MRRPQQPMERYRRAVLAAAAIALLLAGGPAAAVLYKWIDANGRVTYSDLPPPPSVKAEIVNAQAPPSNPAAVRDLANQEAELRKLQTQRADEQKKAVKARADAVDVQQACAEARGRLKLLQSDQPIYRANEQGDTVYVDDAMRIQERQRVEALIRERCAGG